jgi:hypothetical protein
MTVRIAAANVVANEFRAAERRMLSLRFTNPTFQPRLIAARLVSADVVSNCLERTTRKRR